MCACVTGWSSTATLTRCCGWSHTGGVGWYRKALPAIPHGKRAYIRFDGVYDVSEVYINGVLLGMHPYGYTTFQYDLTPHLTGNDMIAVKVLNEGKSTMLHVASAGKTDCAPDSAWDMRW